MYVWMLVRIWRPELPGEALASSLMWLGLTIAFELLCRHYVVWQCWSRLRHEYNVCTGRVWLVVPIWVTVAPYAFYRLQK
jgi:hypothetical protein